MSLLENYKYFNIKKNDFRPPTIYPPFLLELRARTYGSFPSVSVPDGELQSAFPFQNRDRTESQAEPVFIKPPCTKDWFSNWFFFKAIHRHPTIWQLPYACNKKKF